MRHDEAPPQVPAAIAAPRDRRARRARQLRAWLTTPPAFARDRLTWAASAAVVASAIQMVTLFGWSFCGCELSGKDHHDANFLGTLFVAVASLFLALGLFPPLRLAAGLYYLVVRKDDPRWTAAWIAATQLAAHVTVLGFLGAPIWFNAWVPLTIGALWGAWLPKVAPPEIS